MIRVEKLSLSYRKGITALRSIDLQISPGENIALIGANSSGKTTLARCLNGLQQPQEGRVLVDGMDASDSAQLHFIRQLVGMVLAKPGRSASRHHGRRRIGVWLGKPSPSQR